MSVSTMTTPAGADEKDATEGKGGKKKLVVVVVLLVVLGGAGYWFFLKPKGGHEAPVPGEVVALESTQINLASGHYLRIAIALQLPEGAAEVDGSKALDATISLFSGRSMTELNDPKEREKLKKELGTELEERYDDEVMGVYFTEFVTQ
jgi:flagellar FliL protein